MNFSIRLNDAERKLADSYAKLHGITLEQAFKDALFERIEDEFDIAIDNDDYKEYSDSVKESKTITKLWKEVDANPSASITDSLRGILDNNIDFDTEKERVLKDKGVL